MTVFGVHTGLQSTSMDELIPLWRRIEELGFGWISIWDHFYAADTEREPNCLEAVAAHAALACATERVTCGSLVYAIGYRHPAVIAKAITTIDHLSHGRAALGLGAGWNDAEYAAYGIPFPSPAVRLDQLEEGAACIRGLLRQPATTFAGNWFRLADARNEPRPVQDALPIWIGGGGERRTLRIAARFADGWNLPFGDPETFAHKRARLHDWCTKEGRDPGEIRCSVNVPLAWSEESLIRQFGRLADAVRASALLGNEQSVLDQVGRFVVAGADQLNIALRAPYDVLDLERLAAVLFA